MTTTLKFYSDASLTSEITTGAPLPLSFASDGSTGALDAIMYLGSTASAKTFKDAAAPGTGQIVVSITDSASGSGQAATAVKLALSGAGLAGAVAGASLNVGTQILSGVANRVPIYLRVTPSSLTAGTYLDLGLLTSNVQET